MGKREATRVPKALSAVEWAAFAFLIDAFEGVGGPELSLMGSREGKSRKPLRQVILHPGGEFWSLGSVARDDRLEPGLGAGEVRGVEEGSDVLGHLGAH